MKDLEETGSTQALEEQKVISVNVWILVVWITALFLHIVEAHSGEMV